MTLITPEELADLEAKARLATPGDWKLGKQGCDNGFVYAVHDRDEPTVAMQLYDADAAHIAANAPDVTLRLIATIRALTARAAAAEKERGELRRPIPGTVRGVAQEEINVVSKIINPEAERIGFVSNHLIATALEKAAHFRRAARLLPAEPDHGEA